MLRSPFLLAMLLASLVANVSLFLSPYDWENDKYPPRQDRSEQSSREQRESEVCQQPSPVQIERDLNCAASDRHNRGDYPGALKRYLLKTTDDPIAGFTGLLFIATCLLAMIARSQVKDSRAVQRAHVSVLSPQSEILKDDEGRVIGLRVWVIWKNSGTTPASPVIGETAATWVPSVDQFEWGRIIQERNRQPFVLGPGAEIQGGSIDIGVDHVRATFNGQGAQFLWGWARYRDIFPGSPEHVVEFCFSVTVDGQLGLPPFKGRVVFAFHGEHNRYYDKN
jgi:hypothetical protein